MTNFKLRITNPEYWFRNSLFLCLLLFFSGNIFAQNLETLAQIVERGNVEQKRDALLHIRNLHTAEASRIAVPLLKDSSEIVRATAAFSVIYLPKNEAFSNLVPLLADKKPLVRRETAYALGKVGDASAIVSLWRLFQKDKVVEVKNAAIVALGEIGDASVVADLTKVLNRKVSSKDNFLRRSAARSIGQTAQIIQTGKIKVLTPEKLSPVELKSIETPKYPNLSERFPQFRQASTSLIEVLQNKNEADDTRREAAFALGAIGDESAAAALRSNLTAEDYYLAEICRESLLKIKNLEQTSVQKSN